MALSEPRLDFGTIATNPTESVRPDLWPTYALAPAYGNQGRVLFDVANRRNAATITAGTWGADEVVFNGASTKIALPTTLPLPGTGPFWFAARFRVSDPGVGSAFVQPYYTWDWADFGIFVSAITGLRAYVRNSAYALISAAEVSPSATTYTVAVGRDGNSGIAAYIDGVLAGTNTGADININSANAPALGYLQGNSTYATGGISHYLYGVGEISSAQLADISSDIDLPFRRAPQVSYFIAAGLAIPIILNQARRRRT